MVFNHIGIKSPFMVVEDLDQLPIRLHLFLVEETWGPLMAE
jgi:hypothetical protein